MKQGSKQDDYGGNHYGKRRRAKAGEGKHSFVCDDCSTLQYLLDRELSRAAKPHCKACGGLLLETKSEIKRAYSKPAAKAKPKATARRRCPGCGCSIFHNEELGRHLLEDRSCFQYQIDTDRPVMIKPEQLWVIPGTVYIDRVQRTSSVVKWVILGVTINRQWLLIKEFNHQYLAKDWIANELGPVSLAR